MPSFRPSSFRSSPLVSRPSSNILSLEESCFFSFVEGARARVCVCVCEREREREVSHLLLANDTSFFFFCEASQD